MTIIGNVILSDTVAAILIGFFFLGVVDAFGFEAFGFEAFLCTKISTIIHSVRTCVVGFDVVF